MKLLSIVTADRVTAAGFLVALGISLFIGAEAHAVDPVRDRPTENADGTLNFDGVSDRKLLEFTANQIWLANRRADAAEVRRLEGLAKMAEENANIIERVRDMSRMVGQVQRDAVQPYLPGLPDHMGNFGKYLYRDYEPVQK